MNNNKKYFPVYKGTLADARKELSIDLYLDSKQWNLACKTAIEYILDRNRTTNLKQAVKELLAIAILIVKQLILQRAVSAVRRYDFVQRCLLPRQNGKLKTCISRSDEHG